MRQTVVSSRIGAGAMFGQNDDARYRSRDLRRAVYRSIIDDDYLQLFRWQALRPDSVETAANRGAPVPDSYDNAYQRVMHWGHIRCSGQSFYRCETRVSCFAPRWSRVPGRWTDEAVAKLRSEEHTSELQSLMRLSYAVFCLQK